MYVCVCVCQRKVSWKRTGTDVFVSAVKHVCVCTACTATLVCAYIAFVAPVLALTDVYSYILWPQPQLEQACGGEQQGGD